MTLRNSTEKALRIAKRVADETGTLMARNICNTGVYVPHKKESIDEVHANFKVNLVLLPILAMIISCDCKRVFL